MPWYEGSDVRRIVICSKSEHENKFCSNEISTCKYSPFTFFPRFLYEQFRRCNNIFFLTIALLQQIPDVSPTGRYVTALPLALILALSAVKEIFEDLKRRRSDRQVNSFHTFILEEKNWTRRSWREVRVGDLVRVDRDQLFPADLLLLSSSEPQGTCYIETSNLDGETNLKVKQALPAAASLSSPHELVKCRMVIECEPPNRHVDEFSGNIVLKERLPLGIDQLLLRGARLKNTAWIFGAVVYTGCDSKLLMNAKKAPLKNCTVDKKTNTRILFLFIILVTISVLSAIGSQLWLREHLPSHWYISFLGKERVTFLWQTLTFFILYNNLIPISLQVTMEIVRFFQANYINIDQEMYDKKSGSSSVARTSNLNEELGLVKYVMSDKTGTLTQNVMTFKQISVAGKIFGDSRLSEFSDERLLEEYKALPRTRNREDIGEILTMMAVCHTVVPEKADGKVTYQYSSPDEGALVRGAAAQGFVLNSRTPHYMVLSIFEEEKMFEILDVIDFTSERKRMSVILRDSSNRIKLYTKGADTVIMERLTCESDGAAELCEQHLEQFASHGYRTLCFAMRELEEEEYTEWSKGYHEAGVLITGRQEALAEEAEKIEIELRLVGATAIEDKLQEYVPETIRVLTAAGIRVWMLTGDKRETALNIAYSCELCDSTTEILFVDEDTFEDTYTRLVQLNCQSELFAKEGRNFVTVIDGKSLVHAMVGECRPYFGDLALRCRAVVCCRMCPMQKAEVVEMVQAVGNHIVLAVGDGANDVAMIQAANVGVGISGEEGLQAASASDYAIPRFHFLRRLLLVHGAWNHDRSVKVIFYSFYKNICLYIIELWFAFFSSWSGQTLFERWTIGMFNVFFTSWPPIIMGLFDRPLDAEHMMKFPSLYENFQDHFSLKRFFLWVGMAIFHSLSLFFLSFGYLDSQIFWRNGMTDSWLMLGNSTYTFVVITVCLKALIACDSWTWPMVAACFGSIVLWLLALTLYAAVFPSITIRMGSDMAGMAWIMMSSSLFWLALVLIPTATLLWDLLIGGIFTIISPSPRQIILMQLKGLPTSEQEWVSSTSASQQRISRENFCSANMSLTENRDSTRMEAAGLSCVSRSALSVEEDTSSHS